MIKTAKSLGGQKNNGWIITNLKKILSLKNLVEGSVMNILKMIASCGVCLMAAGSVSAEDVKMFSDGAPSAEEMGSLLFSGPKPGGVKMRSISFGKSKATPQEVPQLSESTQASTAIGLPIKFAYNSTEVLEESKPYLNEIGKMLALPDYAGERLIIEGHTDASGPETYNKQLSEQRAQAVKNYLRNNFNVSSDRLLVTGMGESQALPNSNPYAAINRRVQFRKAPY